jgi:bifunctional enzyme CysN/CysC
MAHKSELIAKDIDQYLRVHEKKSLLRFITCGSVDDGKSTLIGRLLFESKMIFEDQLAALEADSKKLGTTGGDLDFALLLDGLTAEREQGITIDVAYRFFSTERRKFIVADTPGHEQYTRNMATGASTADLAVILIDARKGVLTQTRRHSYLVSLLGIRHVVLAVNKMDLRDYSREVFDRIVAEYRLFAARLGFQSIVPIPLSALKGDNVVEPGGNMRWYTGPTLMGHLESIEIEEAAQHRPLRLPVQWVNRPDQNFRGFAGLIAGGTLLPGDRVRVLPSGKESHVARIVTMEGDLSVAVAGQSVTVTLADEVDVSRGDMLVAADAPAGVSDRFEATVVWMHETPLEPGKSYFLKIGAKQVAATLETPKHQVNVNTLEKLPAKTLALNEIGVCEVALLSPIPFDAYAENRETGGFILIDRISNDTVAAGMLQSAASAAERAGWDSISLDARERARRKNQRAFVAWFGGGSADAAAARLLEKRLHALGRHTYLLETERLGAPAAHVGEIAALMLDAGLIVLVCASADSQAQALRLRERFGPAQFRELDAGPAGPAGSDAERVERIIATLDNAGLLAG